MKDSFESIGSLANKIIKKLSFGEIHDLARLQARDGDEAARRHFAGLVTKPLNNALDCVRTTQ